MFYIKAKKLIPIGDSKFLTKDLYLTNYRGIYMVVKKIHPLTKDGKLDKWFLVDGLGVNGYYPAEFVKICLPKKYYLDFKINYLTK